MKRESDIHDDSKKNMLFQSGILLHICCRVPRVDCLLVVDHSVFLVPSCLMHTWNKHWFFCETTDAALRIWRLLLLKGRKSHGRKIVTNLHSTSEFRTLNLQDVSFLTPQAGYVNVQELAWVSEVCRTSIDMVVHQNKLSTNLHDRYLCVHTIAHAYVTDVGMYLYGCVRIMYPTLLNMYILHEGRPCPGITQNWAG